MEAIRSIVRAGFAAALVAGIALRLLENTSGRQCIKTTAALYILVVVLRAASAVELNLPIPAVPAAGAAVHSAQDEDVSLQILEQSSMLLQQQMETALREQGIHAAVRLDLENGTEGVTVRSAHISLLDSADQPEVQRILESSLHPSEMIFETKG